MHRATSAPSFDWCFGWLVAFLWRAGGSEGFVVKWVRHSSLHHNHNISSHPIPSQPTSLQIWSYDHKTACQLTSHCITWYDRTPNRIASHLITSHRITRFFLLEAAWVPVGPGRSALHSAKQVWKVIEKPRGKTWNQITHKTGSQGGDRWNEWKPWVDLPCKRESHGVSVKVMVYVPVMKDERHGEGSEWSQNHNPTRFFSSMAARDLDDGWQSKCRMKTWCACCVDQETHARMNRSWIQWKLSKLDGNQNQTHKPKNPRATRKKEGRGEGQDRKKRERTTEKREHNKTNRQATNQTNPSKKGPPNQKHHQCQPLAAEKECRWNVLPLHSQNFAS